MLPGGTGKTVRIVVFAQGEAAKIAEDAGAEFVGSDEFKFLKYKVVGQNLI
ncbi:MAG: hypothetical protein CM1200mP37_4760 [Chloroflexota bacterium]|nr:MAG: hypothetical protein CM1200mP37_4760 [Chloroflexota bacterium]